MFLFRHHHYSVLWHFFGRINTWRFLHPWKMMVGGPSLFFWDPVTFQGRTVKLCRGVHVRYHLIKRENHRSHSLREQADAFYEHNMLYNIFNYIYIHTRTVPLYHISSLKLRACPLKINWSWQKENPTSKHWFSGAMLVFANAYVYHVYYILL